MCSSGTHFAGMWFGLKPLAEYMSGNGGENMVNSSSPSRMTTSSTPCALM
jgi:hypothetical protein